MPTKRASHTAVSRRVFGHGRKTPLRAGLYARISTHDQQTLSLQRRAMRGYVARRDWTIAIDVKEVGSGASVRELRQKLLDAAHDIDVVVVWRLDRWGRSMADLVTTLQELRDLDRLRVIDGSSGSDHALGPCNGGPIGGLCRV